MRTAVTAYYGTPHGHTSCPGWKQEQENNRSLIPQIMHTANGTCKKVGSDGTYAVQRDGAYGRAFDGADFTGTIAAVANRHDGLATACMLHRRLLGWQSCRKRRSASASERSQKSARSVALARWAVWLQPW